MATILNFTLWLILMVMVASICNKVDFICHRLNEISKAIERIKEGK